MGVMGSRGSLRCKRYVILNALSTVIRLKSLRIVSLFLPSLPLLLLPYNHYYSTTPTTPISQEALLVFCVIAIVTTSLLLLSPYTWGLFYTKRVFEFLVTLINPVTLLK